MLAFVAGGTGFVGSNLVAALIDRGISVRVPGRALTEADHFNLAPHRFPYGYSKHLAAPTSSRSATW